MRTILLVTLFLARPSLEPDSVHEKIVEFAEANIGKKVGDGDCSALPREALQFAGARRRGSSWGDEVHSVGEVQPGDILQFVDVVIVQRVIRQDGAVVKLVLKSPNHFAVVENVEKQSNKIRWILLHQNAGFTRAKDADKKVVQRWTFNLAEKRSGLIKAFHPLPARP